MRLVERGAANKVWEKDATAELIGEGKWTHGWNMVEGTYLHSSEAHVHINLVHIALLTTSQGIRYNIFYEL